MGLGEVLNFVAYAFAPASLVTPLGALSVIIAALMASRFLNERLNLLGKLGCFLCIVGSTIIVIHSPKEAEIQDLELLIEKLKDSVFITYVMVVLTISLFISCYLGPRYGHKNCAIYILLCSLIGSLTVMSCKALGLAIRDQISGKSNDFGMGLPYALMFISVIFIAIQMNYLNKALDIFNTSIVTPVYYVIFTSFVLAASAILFKEWVHMKAEDIIGDLCGFTVVIVAVILLNAFREMDVSIDDLRNQMKPKRRLVAMGNINQRGSSTSIQFEETLMQRTDSKEFKSNYGTSSDVSSDMDRNV